MATHGTTAAAVYAVLSVQVPLDTSSLVGSRSYVGTGQRQCPLNGSQKALGLGKTLASNIKGCAMIWRCAAKGQADGGIHGLIKRQHFDGDQTLIVIERQVGCCALGWIVPPGLGGFNPEGIRRYWPCGKGQAIQQGLQPILLLCAQLTVFATVGI